MPIVKKYKSEVINIENPIEGLFVVTFKSLDSPFKYLPGQFLHLALDEYNPSEPWPESRCFSMQTCDDNEYLKITYSVKGKFTTRMSNELKVGKIIYLKLPYGDLFIKPHSKNNTVFIAGGTGITPFLSLFNSHYFIEYKNPYLYLGVRNKNFNIYQNEIDNAKLINPSFDYKIYFENTDGILNINKIFNNHGNNSTYFISGPPIMIKTFKNFLLENNTPLDNIRTDDWE